MIVITYARKVIKTKNLKPVYIVTNDSEYKMRTWGNKEVVSNEIM